MEAHAGPFVPVPDVDALFRARALADLSLSPFRYAVICFYFG